MRRVPFAVWLVPGIVALPVVSGPLIEAPGWLKVTLAVAGVALPSVVVITRYRLDPDPSDREVVRRRLVASTTIVLAVFALVWMAGGVDHRTTVPLDPTATGNGEAVAFDVAVRLPTGGLLRDLEPIGGRVKVFFPNPDNPAVYRLIYWEPPVGDDLGLEVIWSLSVWRTVGEVTVSMQPATEDI